MRRFLVCMVSIASSYVVVRFLCWRESRRRRARWERPGVASQMEQITAQLRDKDKTMGPLDVIDVMANVQAWRDEENERRKHGD